MKSLLGIVLTIIFTVPLATAQVKPDRRPNFIIIYTDDQRQDALGANGNPNIITPSLDRLANNAVSFTNANVVFSLCSPSRAAMLTGRYGSVNGVLGLGSALNPDEKTIASYLNDAGYRTGMSGKWHIKQRPKDVGFDFYSFFESNGDYYNRLIHDMDNDVRPAQHCDEYSVGRSIDFLKDAAQKDKPFFLFHCTQLPHMDHELKWHAQPETLAKYNEGDMPIAKNRLDNLALKPGYLLNVRNLIQAKEYGYPEADAIQQHTKQYYSVITEMDDALGRLIDAIEALGIGGNTYIIFMSDNGWMLGDHGFTSKVLPYRPSTHVPLFILGPGLERRTEEGIALNIDVAPTIMELAGVKIPKNVHGKSLVPVLKDKSDNVRDAFVYEGLGDYGGTKPNLTVITEKYRYIETYQDESLNEIVFRELYDQEKDPDEMTNVVHQKAYRKQIKGFSALIRKHKVGVLKNRTN